MIKLENASVMNLENAIRGARNPMNSWAKSDSHYDENGNYILGNNDLDLAQRLRKAGSDHRKYLRQIFVSVDILAPLYWWKEMDQYRVAVVSNSCSTMHKIHSKEFTLDDFSCEDLFNDWDKEEEVIVMGFDDDDDYYNVTYTSLDCMKIVCEILNHHREKYNETKDKRYWRQMIQLLPSSYNQLRTVTMNYETLVNIYHGRNRHKLTEWHTFCDWIKSLPYAKELIICEDTNA